MGMLLTDPSVPPAPQISSTSSNLTSSQSLNVTSNTTSSAPSPGPKLWDMKMFGYLAGPLLFGTIIMPLISGTLLRFVVKTYTHLVPWWRLASAVLWLLCLFGLYTFHNFEADVLRTCFDATLAAVVMYQTYRAFRKKVRRILLSVFLVGMLVCLTLDWFVGLPIPGTAAWGMFVIVCLFRYGLGRVIKKLLWKIKKRRTGELQS